MLFSLVIKPQKSPLSADIIEHSQNLINGERSLIAPGSLTEYHTQQEVTQRHKARRWRTGDWQQDYLCLIDVKRKISFFYNPFVSFKKQITSSKPHSQRKEMELFKRIQKNRQITGFTYITGSNILRIFRHGVKLFGGEFLLSRWNATKKNKFNGIMSVNKYYLVNKCQPYTLILLWFYLKKYFHIWKSFKQIKFPTVFYCTKENWTYLIEFF